MTTLTRQLNNKTVFVFQVRNLADGAVIVFLESLAVYAIERVKKFLWNACQSSWRVVDVVLEVRDEGLEKLAVVFCWGGRLKLVQLFLEQAKESGCVNGGGRCVRVVMRGLGAWGLGDLIKERKEGCHVNATAWATAFSEFDIVFDFVLSSHSE
jgi:hypothetical protein